MDKITRVQSSIVSSAKELNETKAYRKVRPLVGDVNGFDVQSRRFYLICLKMRCSCYFCISFSQISNYI